MGELLKQTLELYSESWKPDHDEVMEKYRTSDYLAEAISFGTFLFEQLRTNLNEDGAAKVEQVDCVFAAVDSWYATASSVLEVVETLESEDFSVVGSELLREYYREAAGILEDLLDAKRAIDAVRNKTAVPLRDYLNELRNPVHR